MKLTKEQEQILGDMGGWFLDGTPKMRIVTPEEAKWPHGELKGVPKYINPITNKAMNCLVLEQWMSREALGDNPIIRPCSGECCRNGFWGMRMPLMYADGEFLPMSESLMDSIRQKNFFDSRWSDLTPVQRQEMLDAQWSRAKQVKDVESIETANQILEDYTINKEREDASDTRAWSMPKELDTTVKGNKMPVGKMIVEL